MGGFFRKMQLKTLPSFWAALCTSEVVKDKLTPHSYIFFGLPRGVKWCKSEGVKRQITSQPLHRFTRLGRPKKM